jgi:hypothetical protein
VADYFDSLWDDLEAKVAATWTGCDLIYRATQSRRINWREMLKQNVLDTPFVAVAVGQAVPTDQYGVTRRTHQVPIGLYYVRAGVLTTAEAATYPIVERLLEKLGKDMVDALLDSADDGYQVVDEPTVDAGDGNPANAIFIEEGVNLLAVEVTFTALIGE